MPFIRNIRASGKKCKNEEATRQQGSLLFKGE
jgi:hypothetical protein